MKPFQKYMNEYKKQIENGTLKFIKDVEKFLSTKMK
jgi:hypothetical protein